MSTAKERRLAKRAEVRAGVSVETDDTPSKPRHDEVGALDETAAPAILTAKDRRLAKRAEMRAAAELEATLPVATEASAPKRRKKHLTQRKKKAAPAEGPSSGDDKTKKKSTAQLRRLAARAIERGEEVPEAAASQLASSSSTTVAEEKPEAGLDVPADEPVLNAKERRLARRLAERNGEPIEEAPPAPATQADDEYYGGIPNVVFVGQLPFSATASAIQDHFSKGAEIPKSDVKVRLLTKKGSDASRGMAFVEFSNAEQQHQALALHRSYFGSDEEGQRRRQINVEKSAGGGRDKKRKRVDEVRTEQEAYMATTVERIIEDYVAKGGIGKEILDSDKHLLAMLKRCDASTVDAALAEFSERDVAELTNPAAYLTALVCRKLAEGFDAKLAHKESEKKKQALTAGRGFGSSGRGGHGGGKGGTTRMGRSGPSEDGASEPQDLSLEKRFPSLAGRGRGPRRGI